MTCGIPFPTELIPFTPDAMRQAGASFVLPKGHAQEAEAIKMIRAVLGLSGATQLGEDTHAIPPDLVDLVSYRQD